jgi:nitrous oxidase accessory protein NosD
MLAAVPAAASAETEVDCETQSLQGAVDGADLGDVLHVSNGPCSGDVVIDKDLTIRGNRATQLDADVSGSITVAASASVMLDNLNLSGSYGHRTVAAAGSVTLRDSEIYGGGLEVDDGAATLIDTVLQESVYEFNQGGGIYSCGKLHITGGWIGDNFAAEGAGIYVACGETTISGTRFGGNGALHGGAMFVAAAAAPTVTISDVELTYNEGYETGGAIHVAGGNVTVIDSTITDNTAEDGGGIYNVGGTVTVRDTLLEGNEATARPGPRIVQEGTETFSGPGPHLLENVHITTKQGPCVLVSGASDVTIRNVELGPCGTEGIFIQGQTYDVGIYDSYIHPESSAGSGIAIRIDHSSDIEVAGNVIAHGSSNLYAFVASNLDVTNNLLINPLGPYNNNKQIQVWGEPETPELNDPDLVNSFYVDIKHNVLINSADPFWGPSPDPGDAINIGYTIDADIEGNHIIGGHGFQACGIITDNATVHGALIRDNVLVGTAQCGIGIAGGAGIEVSGNSILNGHVNTPYPGGNVAMYANNFYAGETPVCDAITIEDNTATAVFRDGTFRDFDNPNVDSSGICKDASGSPVTRDSVAADNVLGKSAFKALDPPHRTRPVPHLPARLDETLVDSPWTAGPNRPNGNGGAVYNAIGQFHLVESTVANNKAGNSGGGVYNGWLGSVVADRTKIAGNTAMAGGAVANRGGDVTLRRSRVNADPALSRGLTGNRAMISGGAIHNWYGFVAIRAVDIVGNTARAGGGISNDVGGIVKVKRSKLLGNVASGGGGAIFTVGGTTIVRESAIEGNSADRGGGIHALLGTLEVHDASIAANSADAKGAGVALGSINQSDASGNLEVGPTARFLDADIDRNHGDGIHASAGTRLELRRTRIRANTGSGIVAEDPGAIVPFVEVEVRKSKIKQNGRHGLEIHGTLLVKNSTIAQNRRSGFTLRGPGKLRTTKIANNHAGGWIGCGRTVTDVVMDSVEIKGNEPNGGLYVDCGDVSIVDSSFVRNRDALEGGGALFIAATAPVAKDGAAVLWDPLDGNSAGTASGEPEYVAAQPGRGHALELLDGDYVKYTIPAWEPAADADPPDGTIDFWIRPRRYGMSLAVLQWNDAASPPAGGYIGNLSITDDGKLKWTSWTPGTASDPGEPPIGESTIPLDRWSHVAVTWGASGPLSRPQRVRSVLLCLRERVGRGGSRRHRPLPRLECHPKRSGDQDRGSFHGGRGHRHHIPQQSSERA